MLSQIRFKLAALRNRFQRRKGPALKDQCAQVIMHTCALQLERGETRELAPVSGAYGAMLLSGGAITKITYQVFDTEADRFDKTIQKEPWRAFAKVTMLLSLDRDPEFDCVFTTDLDVPLRVFPAPDFYKAPGLRLIQHLSSYFPLLPRPSQSPLINPFVEDAS